jgi:hypothetical protein
LNALNRTGILKVNKNENASHFMKSEEVADKEEKDLNRSLNKTIYLGNSSNEVRFTNL